MLTSVAVLTLNCAIGLRTPSNVAVILASPGLSANATPMLLTVAIAGLSEFHTVSIEMSCVVPSLKVPVAVNRCGTPTGVVAEMGVTVIEVTVAFVTFNETTWDMGPNVTVIVTGLLLLGTDVFAFTRPVCPPTVAIVLSEEAHVAWLVMFTVLPLFSLAVAKYRRLVPSARTVLLGVTAIDTTLAASTDTVVLPLMPFFVAVIVTGLVVMATPVAVPTLGSIVTLVVSDDVHVALLLMSCVVESSKVPVAVYC